MRAFIVSCVVAAILAAGAALILDKYQEPAARAFASSTGVRI